MRAVGAADCPTHAGGQHAALWARDNTNRHLLGRELPVPYVASLHAGLVLAVSPLLARALLHMKTAPGLPTAVAKIAIGVAATGLAYVPLVIAALLGSDGSWWV